MKRIHYLIERDANGLPERLVWSPAIQAEVERREIAEQEKDAEEARLRALPMPSMREWAQKHVWPVS